MGVNLLPFIDWQRLLEAAKKADQNEELLSPAERIRNKPTGEVRLYFQQESQKTNSVLQKELRKDLDRSKEKSDENKDAVLKICATFENCDEI